MFIGMRFRPMVGYGILAYSFGLRHAVDADHIAAIDNVTLKLLRDGKPSLLVGLFFSLGHSSVVALMTLLAMASSSYIKEHLETTSAIGSVVGTLLSASLLFVIGLLNLVSAAEIVRERRQKNSGPPRAERSPTGVRLVEVDGEFVPVATESSSGQMAGGLISRCCPAVFNAVHSETRMFGVGFLFGLGFETSSEVALLALATMAPSSETPLLCTLLLPALFAACMSLIDTIDGVLMFWAYSLSASQARAATARARRHCRRAALAPPALPSTRAHVHVQHALGQCRLLSTLCSHVAPCGRLWPSGGPFPVYPSFASFRQPGGRDCYNLFLTSVSATIAIGIGLIEVLGCLQHEFEWEVTARV